VAARARLLGLGQVGLDSLTRQVSRARAAAVAASLRGRGLGRRGRYDGWVACRWRLVRIGNVVEQGRAGDDALALAAERRPHELVDVGLLPLDGGPQFDHGTE
jgi:hypothetical protein